MKKILTLAIALVMVFALAAPALAAGWDLTIDPDEIDEITLKIQALSLDPEENATMWKGNKGFAILEKTYPVIKGNKLHAIVTVTVPKNISATMQNYLASKNDVKVLLGITGSNASIDQIVQYGPNDGPDGWDITAVPEIKFDTSTIGNTYVFEVWGTTKDSKKEAKITATFGAYNLWNGNIFKFASSGNTYTVEYANNVYTVTSSSKAVMTFPVTGDTDTAKIDDTKALTVDGYNVTKTTTNELAFCLPGSPNDLISSGAKFNELKSSMDEILAVLGFNYVGADYMTKKLYVKYFGTIMEGNVYLTYPSGYVTEYVEPSTDANPPPTGDSASILGFVMIAVALVAAGVVTFKKVRA